MSTKQAEQNRAMTDAIKANVSVEPTNGVFTGGQETGADSMYEKLLPETLTIKQVEAVKHYDTQFVAATARAATELSNEAMGINPSLESATFTTHMYGKDTVTVTANRGGAVDVSVTNRAVDPSLGELKKVFHDFKETFKEVAGA